MAHNLFSDFNNFFLLKVAILGKNLLLKFVKNIKNYFV